MIKATQLIKIVAAAEAEELFLKVAQDVEIQLLSDQFDSLLEQIEATGKNPLESITIEDIDCGLYQISIS